MRKLGVLMAVPLLLVVCTPAGAMDWSIGSSLGFTLFSPGYDNAESQTTLAWPAGELGLRVGFMGQDPRHGFFIDTGLMIVSQDPVSARSFQATGNYQYNFNDAATTPYVTVGAGLVSVGYKEDVPFIGEVDLGAMSPIFGGGVGVRRKLGHGHGSIRGEARLDYVGEGEDSGVVVLPKGTQFGLKLGFDLWGN